MSLEAHQSSDNDAIDVGKISTNPMTSKNIANGERIGPHK